METNSYTTSQTTGNGRAETAEAARTTYNDTKGAAKRTGESLRAELNTLKSDLDALVNRASSMSDEELSRAHAQMMAKFSSVRYAAKGFADEASRQLNRSMETTQQYMKERPMQSVGVAVGAGLLLGLLFSSRR